MIIAPCPQAGFVIKLEVVCMCEREITMVFKPCVVMFVCTLPCRSVTF